MVDDVCPLPELDITYFSSSPLAPHGEIAKALPAVRLATKKLLVSVDAVVGLELLGKTLADSHMAPVMPNCVLFRGLQRIEILVRDITDVNPLSIMCFVLPN